MVSVLLATRSAGKIAEIRAMAPHIAWRGLDEFPGVADVVEDGATFEENARKKAIEYAQQTGLLALADDSGLEVDALHGAPGVHSAYFAGHPRDDEANNRKLVAALRSVPPDRRTARFRCVMVLARPIDPAGGHSPTGGGRRATVIAQSEGTIEGVVLDRPRGSNGFGYDPYFLVPSLGRTTAELPPDEKNAISHRGRALRSMLQQLDAIFARGSSEAAGA